MVCNLKTSFLSYSFIKLIIYRFIQIENFSTKFASKMIVTLALCLEPAQATIKTQLRNQPHFLQYLEITIYCSFADIGELFSSLIVYLVGRIVRMS